MKSQRAEQFMAFKNCRVAILSVTLSILTACGGGGGGGASVPLPALPSGSLDTSFSGDGKATTFFFNSTFDDATALLLQSDGKIVVAGSTKNGTTHNFGLARYMSDGSFDPSFDVDGVVDMDLSSGGEDYAHALAIYNDPNDTQNFGKIVVAGSSVNASGHTVFAVVRSNVDGSLDTGFSAGGGLAGVVKTSFCGVFNGAYGVAIQTDGKIVAAGSADGSGCTRDFALARYNVDGSLDTTFGTGGKVTTNFIGSGDDSAYAVAIYNDPNDTQNFGKIVVVGHTLIGGSFDSALVRYNTDGSLDDSGPNAFGTGGGGKITVNFSNTSSGHDELRAVALQADGKIVVAGYAWNGNSDDFLLARYDIKGNLDPDFGSSGSGSVLTEISGNDSAYAVAIYNDPNDTQNFGKIVVAGVTEGSGGGTGDDFALARYQSDGSLDLSFDTDGKITVDFTGSSDFATALAIQADGKIVAAGSTFNGTDSDFAVVRVHP